MKSEVRKSLSEAGMTSVTRNGKRAKDCLNGKVMKGFRGGQFGPMTATCAYIKRNNDVRDNITEVMNDYGYHVITEVMNDYGYHVFESDPSMVVYAKGNERVKFLLIEVRDSRGYDDYWWVLS